MPASHPGELTRFLSATEWLQLGDPATWRWVTPWPNRVSFPDIPKAPAALTRKHRRWSQERGNTHAPPHREIMLMLRGEAAYTYNSEIILRRPGTVVLLDRHMTRDLNGAAWKSGFSCLWLHLVSHDHITFYINTCDTGGRYFHEMPMNSLTGDLARGLVNAWDACHETAADNEGGWEHIIARRLLEARLLSCFIEILTHTQVAKPELHHQQVIHSIKNYISHHLTDNLSLHSLSNIAGYSPYFFHRLFQRHTGQTPVQYINGLRLQRAQELLKAHYTVEAAAFAVGFASASYFHAFFKRHVHLTPRAWLAMQSSEAR